MMIEDKGLIYVDDLAILVHSENDINDNLLINEN